MPNITPYTRAQYPTIEGNDRIYFDNEFRKIQECIRAIITALSVDTQQVAIASGAVSVDTVGTNFIYLEVDTESAAASDDLDTISGGRHGQLLLVKAYDNARTVVVKDSTGNLALSADMSLSHVTDTLLLISSGGTVWRELSRSDNAA
jgi:hypothetical protein